jgi:hypothetical protein
MNPNRDRLKAKFFPTQFNLPLSAVAIWVELLFKTLKASFTVAQRIALDLQSVINFAG